MAFVPETHPDARFCVTCYRSEQDEANEIGVDSYYTSLSEAKAEFARVTRGAGYFSVYLGRFISEDVDWDIVEYWPDDDD